MKEIALLGPGTFSEEAARFLFAETPIKVVSYPLIEDVFLSTVKKETQLSVIPIENTIEGSVHFHLDWLINKVDLPIRAEWVYPIQMNLIGIGNPSRKVDLKKIRKIATIPVAYAQCRDFIDAYLPDVELEAISSTAEGVKYVKELDDPSVAAIGTASAAKLFDLDVLVKDIHDHNNNFTRFILVGDEVSIAQSFDIIKTTILVTLPEDYPGALHQVLSAFAWRKLNLTKIESRPTKKKLGSYYFYIDVLASLQSVLLPAAIDEIKAIGCQVRILGSYPSYSFKNAHLEV